MKAANAFHMKGLQKHVWEHETNVVFVTDDTGKTWEIRPSQTGLRIRAIGSKGGADDSIRVQPECSNEIRLYSTQYEES